MFPTLLYTYHKQQNGVIMLLTKVIESKSHLKFIPKGFFMDRAPALLQLNLGSLAAVKEPYAAVVVLQGEAGDASRRGREARGRAEEHYTHP